MSHMINGRHKHHENPEDILSVSWSLEYTLKNSQNAEKKKKLKEKDG